MAWLGLIETGSILIREKRKYLSRTSDRVSKSTSPRVLKVENGSYKYISIIEAYSLLYTLQNHLRL
jgi:hypothetical protein